LGGAALADGACRKGSVCIYWTLSTLELVVYLRVCAGVYDWWQVLGEYKLESLFPHWQLLTHERTTQHNIRVSAKYYKRIRTVRLAEILGLSVGHASCARRLGTF